MVRTAARIALFLILLFLVPESPRFMVLKKQEDRALGLLQRINTDNAKKVLAEVKESLKESRAPWLSFGGLVIIIGILLSVFQQFVGINVVLYYAGDVFRTMGAGNDAALLQTIIVGAVNLTFTVVAIFTVDRFGRKPLMIIGAVAMGMDVVMFFTFWGTPVLRDKSKHVGGKDMMGKMFGAMLPKGPGAVKSSKMNMGGMGTAMMKSLMKKKNVASLEEMFALAKELGVRIVICEMSMDLMGFKREEMIAYKNLEFGGVARFLEEASTSKVQLFI